MTNEQASETDGQMGIRVECVTWRYPIDCSFCEDTIPAGEYGIYGQRREDPTARDDDYEESYAWHLECARVLGETLLGIVQSAEAKLTAACDRAGTPLEVFAEDSAAN